MAGDGANLPAIREKHSRLECPRKRPIEGAKRARLVPNGGEDLVGGVAPEHAILSGAQAAHHVDDEEETL